MALSVVQKTSNSFSIFAGSSAGFTFGSAPAAGSLLLAVVDCFNPSGIAWTTTNAQANSGWTPVPSTFFANVGGLGVYVSTGSTATSQSVFNNNAGGGAFQGVIYAYEISGIVALVTGGVGNIVSPSGYFADAGGFTSGTTSPAVVAPNAGALSLVLAHAYSGAVFSGLPSGFTTDFGGSSQSVYVGEQAGLSGGTSLTAQMFVNTTITGWQFQCFIVDDGNFRVPYQPNYLRQPILAQ